mgnify:CR=1 FL=1
MGLKITLALGVFLAVSVLPDAWAQDTNATINGKDTIDYSPLDDSSLEEAGEFTRQNDVVKASKFFKAKRYAEALQYYKKASETIADDGGAKIMMGYCYYYMKQYPSALKQYQTVRELGKSAAVRERARKLELQLSQLMTGTCPGSCRNGFVLKKVKGKDEIVKCPICGGTGKVTPRK